MSLGAIILAAGASSRLGQPKQLLHGPRGPLVQATIGAARDAGADPIVVVLGAHAEQIEPSCGGAQVVRAARWAEGQQASLAAGVEAMEAMEAAGPTLDGAFLLVCDQPALTAPLLVRLHDAFRRTGADAAAAHYGGQAGVPAIVSARLFARLRGGGAPGGAEAGARALLRDPSVRTALVEWPDGAFDVDTPADAARLAALTAPRTASA